MAHRILIVADQPSDRLRWEAYLTGLDCELETTANADDVALLMPELIVLDSGHMPRAWDICEQLKSAQATRHIPILVVTSSELSCVERTVTSGADDLVCHPIDPGELLARVRILLRTKSEAD